MFGRICQIFTHTLDVKCEISQLLALHLKMIALSNPSPWLSQPLSVSCIKLDKSLRLVCQGRPITVRLSGRKPLRCRKEELRPEKLSSKNRCTSPWECTHFHASPSLRRESITSTMGLQMAVSGHTRLSALEYHSRRPCSEGGQGRVTGQDRAAGGCKRHSLDHTGTFHITIRIFMVL